MKINLSHKRNENLNSDEISIELQYSTESENLQHFINYINDYPLNHQTKAIVANDNNYTLLEIELDNIILFYSDKKYNYCKTKSGQYRIKSKLYELENIDKNFIRVSKSCIVNMNHVKKFDISEISKIIIKLDDSTEEIVSRRRTQNIMKYLDDRRI